MLSSIAATVTITVIAVNDPPLLGSIEPAALIYVPKQPATPLTSTLTAGDVDSPMLTGATVQITAGYQKGQDVLLFTNTGTITGRPPAS